MNTAPPRPAVERFDLLIEFLLIALLVFMPAAFGTVHAWSEMIAICAGGAIAVLLAARYVLSPEDRWPSWIIWAPIVLFILIAAIQLLPLPADAVKTISPRTHELKTELLSDLPDAPTALARIKISFYPLGTRHDLRISLLAITIFATVLVIYRDPRRMMRLLVMITVVGAAVACYAIAQKLAGARRPSGPFANYSHYGQLMNLSIGAAIALLLMPWRRWMSPFLLALFIALGLATIVLSGTRGGMIAAALAGSITLLVLAISRRRPRLAAVVPLLVAASLVVTWKIGLDTGRLQMNRDIWVMSGQFPLLGTGLGTFQWVYPMFDRTGSFSTAEYADNEYFQTLSETGWLGVAAMLMFVGVIAWHWLRALRRDDRAAAAIALGMGYGLMAVMIHSISDFGQHLPAIAALSAIACGLIVNAAREQQHRALWRQRGWPIAMLVIVIAIAAWTIIGAERARRGESRWYGLAKELDQMRACAAAAVEAEPDNAYYRYWLAVYNWRTATRQFDRGSPELARAAEDVVSQLHATRRLAPTYGPAYSVLGQIETTYLQLPIGTKHVELAAKLEPNDPTTWFAAGRVDARRGDFDRANVKFRRALNLNYTVLDDIFDLYLDELRTPEPAIKLAEGDFYRMHQVGRGMMIRPDYAELGAQTYRRGQYLLADKARRDPTPALLGGAGRAMLESADFLAAEQFYTAALKHDASQVEWHAGRAEALLRLNRLDEAAEETRFVEQHQPDHREIPSLKRRIDEARNKPK